MSDIKRIKRLKDKIVCLEKYACSLKNTTLEVNGTIEGTVTAGSTVDVQLSDSGGVVTPTSVTQVGNDLQIVLPDPPAAVTRSTATLMKTGQTTSYRTGDDGDIEAGRATDFNTLDTAPLHNTGVATLNSTTARFTDTLGGQTYTNDIVLDWSTWNGSTLLGWRRTQNGSTLSWNNAIDGALAVSIGSFTTGWRLPNIYELFSLYNYEVATTRLNYAPFNFSATFELWTSTTNPSVTSNAMTMINQESSTRAKISTSAVQYIPVRTFSLSTLNVLS